MKLLTLGLLFSSSLAFAITPHIYVCNQGGTQVQVVDVNQNSVEQIFGFHSPHVVKVTPDGRQAWVGEDSHHVRVIDTITHSVFPDALTINKPVALAITPDNKHVYVASSDDTISVIRISDRTIETLLTGFNDLQDIKITPEGDYAFATNAGNGTVSVIRTSDNIVVDTITGFNKPLGLTFTNDGNKAYVSDLEDNQLYVLNTVTNSVAEIIRGLNFPRYIAMTPDDSYAYVTNLGSGTVAQLRLSDNKIVDEINLPQPESLAVTPDGKFLYVGSIAGALYKIDTANNSVLAAVQIPGKPSNLAITVDNPPQITFNGCQIIADKNTYNHLTWSHAPGAPVSYDIYSDANFNHHVATVDGSTMQYDDMHLDEGQTYWYYLVANFADGFSTTLGNVVVMPARTCLGGL